MPSSSSFALVATTAALLVSSVLAGQVSQGVHPPFRGTKGSVTCVCYLVNADTPGVNAEDTARGCDRMNGVLYPNDSNVKGNCVFDNNYRDRSVMARNFVNFCGSHWAQCCNMQGDETEWACDQIGPAEG